jgi:hypothetical protein
MSPQPATPSSADAFGSTVQVLDLDELECVEGGILCAILRHAVAAEILIGLSSPVAVNPQPLPPHYSLSVPQF